MPKELHRLFAASIALAAVACAPEAEAPAPGNAQAGEPSQPRSQQDPVGNEATAAANASINAEIGPKPAAASARRCGWLHNPTPANWWLVDRDGQWILGSQGGHQAPGLHDMPDMSAGEWVAVNGHYGYGCACMAITADPATGRVTKVSDAAPKPLAQCRGDRQLPDPGEG